VKIVPNQLRGPERVFFAATQALVCGLALYLGYVAARVLALDAADPGDLNGRTVNLVLSLVLVVALAAAVVTAFLSWTYARGAKIGVTRREAVFFRVVLALGILGSVATVLVLLS
jgi:hypothetical protein